MTDMHPIALCRMAIEAAEAGDLERRDAARARFTAAADQVAAMRREHPNELGGVADPWEPFGAVFAALDERGPAAARDAILVALRSLHPSGAA